jgi:hypothetical protein
MNAINIDELTNEFINAYSDDVMGNFVNAKNSYLDAVSSAKNWSLKASKLSKSHLQMSQEEFQDAVMLHFGVFLKKHGFPKHPSKGWHDAESDALKALQDNISEEYDTAESNREYFDSIQEWAHTAEELEAEISIRDGVYVAHGPYGEMGEFHPKTKTGWMVTKKFIESHGLQKGISFKEFLFEEDIRAVASKKAMDILGGPSYRAVKSEEKDIAKLLDIAKHEKTEKINTPIGPWVISLFKTAAKTFVAAYPPKAYGKDPIFFVKD